MLALLATLAAAPLALALTARERPWLGYLLGGSLLLLGRALAGAGASPLFWIAQTAFFVSAVLVGIPSFRAHLFAGALADRLGPRLRALATLRRAERGAESTAVLQPGPDQLLLDGPRGWERFLALPRPQLEPDEQDFLDGPLQRVTSELGAGRLAPLAARELLRTERITGLQLGAREGGRGFSPAAWSSCVQRLAAADATLGAWVAAASCSTAAQLVRALGTPQQRQALLPELARGRACLALVHGENHSGGCVVEPGRPGEGPLLRLDLIAGAVPLAAAATHVIAVVDVDDPRRLLGDEPRVGQLALVLPRGLEGLELPAHDDALDPLDGLGAVRARACRVPLVRVLGGLESARHTAPALAAALTHARATVLPALTAGLGRAPRSAADPGTGRAQEGDPERSAALAHLLEAGRALGLAAVDAGRRPGPFALGLRGRVAELAEELGRANATPVRTRCIDGERDDLDGLEWCRGGAHLFAEELDAELAALDALDLEAFDRAAAAHLTRLGGRSARAWIDGLRRGQASGSAVAGLATDLFRRVEHVSRQHALAAEWIPLALGDDLPAAAPISARLAAARGWITLAAASLREFHARGQREGERPTVTAAVDLALERAAARIDAAVEALPRARQARALRLLLFPLGRPKTPPAPPLPVAGLRPTDELQVQPPPADAAPVAPPEPVEPPPARRAGAALEPAAPGIPAPAGAAR